MTNITHIVKIAAVAVRLALAPLAIAQNAYPTPEAAADALVDGIARHDGDAIKAVVGADYRKYIPAPNLDAKDVTNFLAAWAQAHSIVRSGNDKAYLAAGKHGWTLPIPIVKTGAGWRFDVARCPGRNTRCAASDATSSRQSRSRSPTPTRRTSIGRATGTATAWSSTRSARLSSPGKRDGLYWASLPGEPESPLGAEFADAKRGQPYHGYLYRILTAQGKDAPGGARSYVRNGRMTDGYALVAWPAVYGDTGVMTFIVNRDGVVYQKNLGSGTDAAGSRASAPTTRIRAGAKVVARK